MSEELRRALHGAAAGQPDVADWVAPVRAGVRARRRRRALQSAAAGTSLVLAAVLGAGALAGEARDVTLEQADPTPSATSSASPSPLPTRAGRSPLPEVSRLAAPLASRSAVLPSRRPTDPALGLDRDAPGAVVVPPAPPTSAAQPSATPRRTSPPRPATAQPTRTPEPAPTAGTQQVVVEIAPAGTRYPAGRSTVTVTATGDGEEPPRVLSLRVDGEPLAADPVLDCRYPTSPPARGPQRATRVFEVDLPPGEHLLEAVADSGCSYYRGRGRTSRTVTAS